MNELIINIKIIIISLRKSILKAFVFIPLFVIILDTIYKSYYGITYNTKQNCIIYAKLPRWAFSIYENLIELWFVVILGIFISQIIEKHFIKIKNFVPKTIYSAFIFASVIPVCACSIIPIIKTFGTKVNYKIAYIIIIAAPLLNPYIVVLSLSVLGIRYTIYRVVAAFIISVFTAIILDKLNKRKNINNAEIFTSCKTNGCKKLFVFDIYEETYLIFKSLFPYLLIAAFISITIDFIFHSNAVNILNFNSGFFKPILLIILGIPIYLCNGADIITLSPLIKYGGLDLAAAVSFSITSVGICFSSFMLLLKLLGKKESLLFLTVFFINVIVIYFLITGIEIII